MIIRKRAGENLAEIIEWIYGILIVSIFLLVLFAASGSLYAYKPKFAYSNWIYLLAGVMIWMAVRWAERFCPYALKVFIQKKSKGLIYFLTALLFGFLVYIVYNYYFVTGWDVEMLLNTSREIAGGGAFDKDSYEAYYFSTYPNNMLLIYIFTIILKLESRFGVLDTWSGIMGILTFQCFISAMTGLIVYKIALKSRKSLKFAWNTWVLYVMIVGVSPWVSIPYSDSMGIVFPVLILYFYIKLRERKHTVFQFVMMAMVGIVGFKIKPQLFIVVIAIGITVFLDWMQKDTGVFHLNDKRYYKNIAGIILGVAITLAGCHFIVRSIPIETNDEETFSLAHFAMMGLNPVTNGGYLEEDVLYTHNQDKEERTKANVKVIKERLKDYGVAGFLDHVVKKTLNNYSDGTWAWGAEGGFYTELLEDKNQGVSPFLKSIYYSGGSRYSIFCSYSQMMWMLLLFGCLMAFVFRRKGAADRESEEYIILLSILGLTIFELIFESRARYLYCYVPFFILLGHSGLERMYDYVKIKILRKR